MHIVYHISALRQFPQFNIFLFLVALDCFPTSICSQEQLLSQNIPKAISKLKLWWWTYLTFRLKPQTFQTECFSGRILFVRDTITHPFAILNGFVFSENYRSVKTKFAITFPSHRHPKRRTMLLQQLLWFQWLWKTWYLFLKPGKSITMLETTLLVLIFSILLQIASPVTVKEYSATTSSQYISKTSLMYNGDAIWRLTPSSAYTASSYYLEVYWMTFSVQGKMPNCHPDYVEVFVKE